MSKAEKIFNRLTWIFIVAGIVSGIYSATRGEQPTWLDVFLHMDALYHGKGR